jgi:hypothetical protein
MVEVILAHPTGVAEVTEGRLEPDRLELRPKVVATTTSAKVVTSIERDFHFDGEGLRYDLRMAAVGHPLTHHLAADLKRQASGDRGR